jgi:hypothetical protein
MANKQSLFKKGKNILDTKINNSWLHNVYVLYFIFLIALGNAYYLLLSSEWYYLTIFVIIGYLTSFFSRNIIVILCIAMATTNILRVGIKTTMEGFENDKEEKEEKEKEEKEEMTNNKKSVEEALEENEKKELDSDYENPTQESKNKKKDGFQYGVYTTMDDMDINQVYKDKDKILKNQEKLLKNLNQYKPLLDTINSITKSVSSIKEVRNTNRP